MKENKEAPFAAEAKLVRAFRESKGLSQVEFAELLKTSIPTLSNIENGKRRLSGHIIKQLSKAGMNMNDLSYINRNNEDGQSFAYRLAEVENRLVTMETTLQRILALLDEKK